LALALGGLYGAALGLAARACGFEVVGQLP